jgi:hypothetical protein
MLFYLPFVTFLDPKTISANLRFKTSVYEATGFVFKTIFLIIFILDTTELKYRERDHLNPKFGEE